MPHLHKAKTAALSIILAGAVMLTSACSIPEFGTDANSATVPTMVTDENISTPRTGAKSAESAVAAADAERAAQEKAAKKAAKEEKAAQKAAEERAAAKK